NGHEAIVKLLLGKNADVESKPISGQTPLWMAAKYNTVVELLCDKGANVNPKDEYFGRTLLSWAAGEGREAVVELLLEKGANVNLKDNFDRTPLWWAAGNGHEAIVKLLFDKGANVNSKDKDGRTPLSWAAENGYEAVVRLLQSS